MTRSTSRLSAVLPLVLYGTACAMSSEEDAGRQGQALGVTGPAFYVDGALYRTVGTPTDLPTAAPADSFDTIYDVSKYQAYNVADAAPGKPGYHGGRWMVHALSFADYASALAEHDMNASGDFDSNEEIEAALAAGDAMDLGVVRVFVCPTIKLPGSP